MLILDTVYKSQQFGMEIWLFFLHMEIWWNWHLSSSESLNSERLPGGFWRQKTHAYGRIGVGQKTKKKWKKMVFFHGFSKHSVSNDFGFILWVLMIGFKCGEFGMLGTHGLTIFMLASKQSSYTTAVSQCLIRIHQDTILYTTTFSYEFSLDRLLWQASVKVQTVRWACSKCTASRPRSWDTTNQRRRKHALPDVV